MRKSAHIGVRDLCVFAYHGVASEEARLGQRFYIDIDADVQIDAALADDDYAQAVCYGALSDLAVDLARDMRFHLIETLADRIAERALAEHDRIDAIDVTIRKPAAAVAHPIGHAQARVHRTRTRVAGFSLGSNLGARETMLQSALALLGTAEGLRIEAVSGLYDTAPWGGVAQDGFVNLCATARTTLDAHGLLRLCKEIEASLGRAAGDRWGPRAIDVDLLFVDDLVVCDAVLTLPHPHLTARAFVLEPLAELVPEKVFEDRTVAQWLAMLDRSPGDAVRRDDGA